MAHRSLTTYERDPGRSRDRGPFENLRSRFLAAVVIRVAEGCVGRLRSVGQIEGDGRATPFRGGSAALIAIAVGVLGRRRRLDKLRRLRGRES